MSFSASNNFIIIVIFAENASFTCKLRRHLLASMALTTPKPQIRIPMESTQRGHDITIGPGPVLCIDDS